MPRVFHDPLPPCARPAPRRPPPAFAPKGEYRENEIAEAPPSRLERVGLIALTDVDRCAPRTREDSARESLTRFFFTAAQAHCTSVVLSQGAPLRRRLDRRLPALSSLRGHMPAHEMRCASEGNRLMSMPISETMT